MKDCVFRGFSIVPFRHLFCLCPQAVEFTGKMLEHSAYRAAHGAAWFGMRRAWLYAAPFFRWLFPIFDITFRLQVKILRVEIDHFEG